MRSSDRRSPPGPRARAGGPGSPHPRGAAGPRPAFEDVYRTTFLRVWRLLRRLGIPESDREDVTQEAFFRVFRRLNTYDPTVDLVAWVFKIANHVATRHRRLARNHREVLADDRADLPGYRGDYRRIDGVADWELSHLLNQLLHTITDARVLLVLIMHDLEQMTMADITRALRIPERTARDRLAKGRKVFIAAVNSLHPVDRAALGVRRYRVIPLFPLDLARLAAAERHLDEAAAEIQGPIWERLQARVLGAANRGQGPGGAARRAMSRIPLSAGQVLAAGLVVFLAGAVAGAGLFGRPGRSAPEREVPVRSAADDAVFAGATTTPVGWATPASEPRPTTQSPPPRAIPIASAIAASPRAVGDLDDQEELLIDRARVHLTRSTPRPDLAITSLRLHAQKYPDSPHAQEREALLRNARALAMHVGQAAAGATTNPTAGEGP